MSRQQVQFPVQQLHIATPSPPPAGSLKLYPKSDNVLYKLTSAGVESAVGVIPDPLTIGTLTVTSALTVNGGANFYGGAGFYNRLMSSLATGGISASAGSEGQLELQNAGSGASKIAFHRTGAYAVYLGLDTDNVMRIGGWSMGAVAYRFLLGDGYSNPGNITMAGNVNTNYLVAETGADIGNGPLYFAHNGGVYWRWNGSQMHTPNNTRIDGQLSMGGYIYGSYANLTADVSGGRPLYVAGQNGDNFLRWWPVSVIGPPSSAPYIDGGQVGTFVDPNMRVLAQLTVNRTGYWGSAGYYHVNSGSEGAGHQLVAYLYYNGVNQGAIGMDRDAGANQGGVGVYAGPVLISNGQLIQLYGNKGYNNQANINQIGLRAYFMATQDYPN